MVNHHSSPINQLINLLIKVPLGYIIWEQWVIHLLKSVFNPNWSSHEQNLWIWMTLRLRGCNFVTSLDNHVVMRWATNYGQQPFVGVMKRVFVNLILKKKTFTTHQSTTHWFEPTKHLLPCISSSPTWRHEKHFSGRYSL